MILLHKRITAEDALQKAEVAIHPRLVFAHQGVVHTVRRPAICDQSGVLQVGQMPGDVRLGRPKDVLNVASPELSRGRGG